MAAELSLRGYSVAITSRNTPGIDLLATSPESGKTYSVQVKTNAKERIPHFWLLGSKPVTPHPNYFFVFVNVKRSKGPPEFFIVRSKTVLKYSSKRKADWNSFYRKNGTKSLDRWDRLK